MKSNNLTLRTPQQSLTLKVPNDLSVRLALDVAGIRVRAACGGIGTCGACSIQTISGEFSPLTLAEWQKIPQQEREQNSRLACQLYLQSDAEVFLADPAPKSNWKSLDLSDWPDYHYPPQNKDKNIYALAVDLGTTHIRLSLWDRHQQKRIASRHGNNPQAALGEDVLTRLDVQQQRSQELESLMQIIRAAIIEGARDILQRDVGEIKSILAKVGLVRIVGNTAMLALLSGKDGAQLYDPNNWEKPIDCTADDMAEWQSQWQMPNANIAVQAPLAGFIGSDILADLMAIDICISTEPVLVADFGTNTEIALWDGQQIWLTSVAGGPAFEGTGLVNGLTAEFGVIRAVQKSTQGFSLDVIGEGEAKGFCASGFVDAIALLRGENIIKLSGRFADDKHRAQGYCLVENNKGAILKPADIDAFQRAKAATASAIQLLLQLAKVPLSDLGKLWVCGAFGQHLNLQNAQAVGLLPTIECDHIELFGNAALSGCEKMLLNPEYEQLNKKLRDVLQVVNVSHHSEYDDLFINQLRLKPFVGMLMFE